jgi:hypothetical protein
VSRIVGLRCSFVRWIDVRIGTKDIMLYAGLPVKGCQADTDDIFVKKRCVYICCKFIILEMSRSIQFSLR